jgi:hypothetical protein
LAAPDYTAEVNATVPATASPEVGDAVSNKAPYNDNSRRLPMLLDMFMKCHFGSFKSIFVSRHSPRVYPRSQCPNADENLLEQLAFAHAASRSNCTVSDSCRLPDYVACPFYIT